MTHELLFLNVVGCVPLRLYSMDGVAAAEICALFRDFCVDILLRVNLAEAEGP